MSEETNGGATGADQAAELRAARAELARLQKLNDDLKSDNYDLREKNRQLKAKPIIEDGDVVLKGDDLKEWNAYRELGDPRALTKRLAAGDQAATELGEVRRAEVYQRAAKLLGYNPPIFARYAKGDKLDIVIEPHPKEKDADGKPKLVAYVKDRDDQKTPLADYADEHWAGETDLLKEPVARPGTPPSGPRPAMPAPTGGEITLIDQLRSSGYYGPAG
jgi:hypothetical protein